MTITEDGTDEASCLSGKVPCKSFDYACKVDGNGSDVTMIITYPQKTYYLIRDIALMALATIGGNISTLKIVGQVRDDYTFLTTCTGKNALL